MVFVDYEYWFYSYKNKYNLRPDTAAWRAELEKQFDIEDIMIFADFSSPGIGEELAKPQHHQHHYRNRHGNAVSQKRYDGFCYA